jgi:hypothetical protein
MSEDTAAVAQVSDQVGVLTYMAAAEQDTQIMVVVRVDQVILAVVQ